MKIPYIYLLSVALAGCKTSPPTAFPSNKKEWLKDYALCKCLTYAYRKDAVKLNDPSLGIIIDLSTTITLNDRQSLDPFIEKYVDTTILPLLSPKNPADFEGSRSVMFNCINFYKSRELGKMIKDLK